LKYWKSITILLTAFVFSLDVSTASAQEAAPDPRIDACRALMINPPPLGENPPSVRILYPDDGAEVVAPVEIAIETENMEFTDVNHWHVWVDGMLYGMVYEPRTVLNLPPGQHEICANLGDSQHMDIGMPDARTIMVIIPGVGTPTPVIDPVVRPPDPEPALSPLLIAGLIGAAAVGGLFLGSRLGRRGRIKR